MGNVTRSPDSPSQFPAREGDQFAAELMGLKHRGCCVLVTGQVNEWVRAAESRRLFGMSDKHRQRVLLFTDATQGLVSQYLPDGVPPTHSTVTTLDYTDEVRDFADTDGPAPRPVSTAPGSEASASMTELGALLCDPVREIVQTETLRPGEFRLGIATLGVLVDTDGVPATRTFVREIRKHVLSAHGMGHIHLPGSPDPETLSALDSLIDIHIELRNPDTVPEHRWHLLETDQSTGWLPM